MPISGKWIPFSKLNVLLLAPDRKGIYELANRFHDGIIRTIYIGSTEVSLKQRLSQHLDEDEPNVAIKRYAQFFRYQVATDPRTQEKSLMLEFQLNNNGRLPLANRNI